MKRIAVIGAGASGLAQIKQLVDAFARGEVTEEVEIVGFESRDQVGGVWLTDSKRKIYDGVYGGENGERAWFFPKRGEDPSPMYDGLRTNLPYDLMSYRDLKFPEGTEVFPDQQCILEYLQAYAEAFDLNRYIRFNTRVSRLYQIPGSSGRWTIESHHVNGGVVNKEEFDNVCVSNGHYADPWIPEIPGLSTFPAQIMHSRFYLQLSDYTSKTVLIIGSFASGSDLSRQIASLNIGKYTSTGQKLSEDGTLTPPNSAAGDDEDEGYTKVYLSSSGGGSSYAALPGLGDAPQPWREHITNVPLISRVLPSSSSHPKGIVEFVDDGHEALVDVDVIIFATGYNFALPFCKVEDEPWASKRVIDGVIGKEERDGGEREDVGGMKGLGMKGLDELMLFLEGDRSVSFPCLQYQIVPFPLAETQARLTALLWANLLPSFPEHPDIPHNPSNPYWTPPTTPPKTSISDGPPVRKVVAMRQKLVFGGGYQWEYEEYLMRLMAEADVNAGREVPECWKRIENWRKERRADASLRKRMLGY